MSGDKKLSDEEQLYEMEDEARALMLQAVEYLKISRKAEYLYKQTGKKKFLTEAKQCKAIEEQIKEKVKKKVIVMEAFLYMICKENGQDFKEMIDEVEQHRKQFPNSKKKFSKEVYVYEKVEKHTPCEVCLKPNDLKKCIGCEKVYYCGTECQKADWQKHKLVCKK